MKPLSATLNELIVFAEGVVTRPRADRDYAGYFAALANEVTRVDAQPAESIRTTRAAMVVVIAIEEFRQAGEEPGSRWLMLVGAALPLLRSEAWLAMNNEKEARPG
jgi:hypothetical protein